MLRRYGCKARWISSIAIAACTLTACSSEQKLFKPNERATNLSEAGSFHLAVLSVVPWADFKDKLKPDFELKAQEALSAVLPTTQSIDEKLLDAMSLGLQLGLPSTTFSRTETMTRDVDTRREATTGTSTSIVDTKTQVSGALPSFSEKDAAGGRKLTDLPGLATPTIGQDTVLKYQTATALMQEVALLNSYVENAAIRSSSVPYIVRLQLSALPSMRDQPLDLYAHLAFLPDDWVPGIDSLRFEEAPEVLPLLVTDNLSTTQRSRAVDLVRQFELAAGGAAQGVAAQAQLNKIADDLKLVVGSDLNSLFTVGRLAPAAFACAWGRRRRPTPAMR